MPPKKTNLEKSEGNKMINFYESKTIKQFLTEYENPHFDNHRIKIPFRIAVIAASGSGKTQWLLNLISRMNDTFGHIYVCYRASEPLYQLLEKGVGSDKITFFTHISKFIQPTDVPKDKQILMVFDDVVNYSEKEQKIICEYYVRGRKIGKGVSMVYLSQSFFRIPKIIRLQCNYLILLKLGSKRDLNLILSDYGLGVDKDELMGIYKDATQIPFDFLKISTDERNDNMRFSKNWSEFYAIGSDSDSDEEK
jgi:hypothetical protein